MKFNFEFAEKISRTYSDECRPLCHELKLPQTAFDILMFLANNPEYKTARDVVEIRKIKANQQQFTANLFAGIDEEQKKQLTIVMEQLENNMDEIIRRKSHK